jgi:hypothetical protein
MMDDDDLSILGWIFLALTAITVIGLWAHYNPHSAQRILGIVQQLAD